MNVRSLSTLWNSLTNIFLMFQILVRTTIFTFWIHIAKVMRLRMYVCFKANVVIADIDSNEKLTNVFL